VPHALGRLLGLIIKKYAGYRQSSLFCPQERVTLMCPILWTGSRGARTLSIATFSLATPSIKGLFVTSANKTLSNSITVIMLSAIILTVALYLLLCWMLLCWVSWCHSCPYQIRKAYHKKLSKDQHSSFLYLYDYTRPFLWIGSCWLSWTSFRRTNTPAYFASKS
jgi:hypothetical protein